MTSRGILSCTIHSLALVGANLASILTGFLCANLRPDSDQLAVQLPIAIILSIAGYTLWMFVTQRVGGQLLRLQHPREGFVIYCLALVITPLIFVPLHYLKEGYLTSGGNLIALTLFQGSVNVVAISVAGSLPPPAKREANR